MTDVETYYPTTESLGNLDTYSRSTGELQAKTDYDTHDRTVSITLADDAYLPYGELLKSQGQD